VSRPDPYLRNVFINCPFSSDYQSIFRSLLLSVYACGFRPRCALEISDSTQNRLAKIESIIETCKFGIHDISFVELDATTRLPRFNMPFELGMFFAAKRFGSGRQKNKNALVLDRRGFRYRASLSDISGQDISVHKGSTKTVICHVRDWLDTGRQGPISLPGGNHINNQFNKFSRQLLAASKRIRLNASELTYADLCRAIESWLKDNA
jgi:hypothetical protein